MGRCGCVEQMEGEEGTCEGHCAARLQPRPLVLHRRIHREGGGQRSTLQLPIDLLVSERFDDSLRGVK